MRSASDELFNIYGISDREFRPDYEGYLSKIHPGDKEHVNRMVTQAFESGKNFEFEHRIISGKGELKTILGRGEVIRENGKVVKMRGTAQDITERSRLFRILEEKNRELERSNKELESFTYFASHDLQEPLRKVQTMCDLLCNSESAHLSEKGTDLLRRIVRAASRMQDLINDLLAYSRLDSPGMQTSEVQLSEVIEEVREHLDRTIRERGAVISSQDLPAVMASRPQITQMFINLIENAIKYCPHRVPEIRIGCKPFKTSRQGFDQDYWRIDLKDNGIGFEPHYQEKIFQLFQRLHTHSEFSGTGIGLAICKRVAENHGGWIEAQSEPGNGSVFSVFLPAGI
jgi:light-regulated signal transduction histidine kinase (bacteriophytochrome)